MRTCKRGFTLIELMVTLSVLAILILLAVPNMSAWARNAKVRSVAEALQNDLRTAQVEAIKRSTRTVFVLTNADTDPTLGLSASPSSTGKNWYVQVLPIANSGNTTTTRLLSNTIAAQNGVSISAGGSFICFNSAGRLSSAAVTGLSGTCTVGSTAATPVNFAVSITSGDRPLRVQVTLGGKIRICDPNKTLSSSQPDGC